ncbi:MAG: cysteine desulfurase, partial [Thermoplasmatales archaeon]
LVSIMFGNNEIGTIEPIKEIGKITKKHDILFHSDAVQAIGKVPIDVNELNIDLLSISSHKIYGPKGAGALFIRKGLELQTIAHGGGQEKGFRSSTHNTPGIVGLGKACELGKKRMNKDVSHLTKLRDILIKEIQSIEQTYLNGHPEKRLANNAHFRFVAIEGESLNLMLDDKGIAASTGSACSSKKLQASHVLLAIGLNPEEAHGSLRLTLGRLSTKDDVEYVVNELPDVVQKLRNMSPLWNR